MERNDVIKTLECCLDPSESRCARCPYREKMRCKENAMQDALSLIRGLTEENARLRFVDEQKAEAVRDTTLRRFMWKLKDKTRLLTSYDDEMFSAVDIEDIKQIAQKMIGGANDGKR